MRSGNSRTRTRDFRDASRVAPDDVAMNVGWGELFAENTIAPTPRKSFQAALKAEPDNVPREGRHGAA